MIQKNLKKTRACAGIITSKLIKQNVNIDNSIHD